MKNAFWKGFTKQAAKRIKPLSAVAENIKKVVGRKHPTLKMVRQLLADTAKKLRAETRRTGRATAATSSSNAYGNRVEIPGAGTVAMQVKRSGNPVLVNAHVHGRKVDRYGVGE